MQKRPPTDIADYWQIFLRRRWWVIIPAVSIALSVFLVGTRLPKSFRSETLILVDPQKVPELYVKSTVSSEVTDRLQTISQEILSRTRLQKIVDQFGLYKHQATFMTKEDVIELMRKDIHVDVETGDNSRTRSSAAFKISYIGQDPELVMKVTRQIGSLFIEENLKTRQQQAEGTSEFIESELTKASEELKLQEDKIKAFKARNIGSLPEQQQSNLQLLGQLQALLQSNSDALGRAQQQKTYLESMIESMKNKEPAPQKSGIQKELDARRAELVAVEQKYQPGHPDVIRLRNEVAGLEKRAAELALDEAKIPVSSGEPDQMKSQLGATKQELKDRTQRQTELESRIRSLQSRIEILPAIEQQFSDISRDYEVSKANYKSLLERKNSSSMAAEMERHAKGEQFRILDPASMPEKPFKPDLLQLNLLGLVGGILVGCTLGMFFEFKDPSLHTEKDVSHLIPVRVLGSIPMILTQATYAAEKRALKLKYAFSSLIVVVVLGYLVYMYQKSPQLFDVRGWF